MNAHTRKLYDSITGSPAPRDLEWVQFVRFWEDVADDVQQESGDRIAVHINGRRAVFHRQHDGRVPIEDISHARQLLKSEPTTVGAGHVVAIAIDDENARIIDFDLDSAGVEETTQKVRDRDPRARRLRTVERRKGRDDVHDLVEYFDQVAEALTSLDPDDPIVVLGHGQGKSSAAAGFVERLRSKYAVLAHRVQGTGTVDLSAATDADLEAAALTVLKQG